MHSFRRLQCKRKLTRERSAVHADGSLGHALGAQGGRMKPAHAIVRDEAACRSAAADSPQQSGAAKTLDRRARQRLAARRRHRPGHDLQEGPRWPGVVILCSSIPKLWRVLLQLYRSVNRAQSNRHACQPAAFTVTVTRHCRGCSDCVGADESRIVASNHRDVGVRASQRGWPAQIRGAPEVTRESGRRRGCATDAMSEWRRLQMAGSAA